MSRERRRGAAIPRENNDIPTEVGDALRHFVITDRRRRAADETRDE